MLYLEGKGVTRDLGEAFKLFESAAAQNDPWGLNNLGGMYEMGWGTPAEPRQGARPLRAGAGSRAMLTAQANIDRVSGTACVRLN